MNLKYLNNENGQALLPVMMMVLLFFLLSTSVILSAAESRRVYLVEKNMIQARYIAESGVERALAEIKANGVLLNDLLNPPIGGEISLFTGEEYSGGVISRVTIKKEDIWPSVANITITSEGNFEDAKKTMVVKAQIGKPLDFSSGIWANLVQSGSGLWEPTGAAPAPELPRGFFEKTCDRVHDGDLRVSGWFPAEGVCFITGDLYLSGSYHGSGALIAGGGVYIDGDLQRSSAGGGDCLLVAGLGDGGITAQAGANVEAFLYASPGAEAGAGWIVLEEGANINGGVICDRLTAGESAETKIRHDVSFMADPPAWLTAGILINSWGEIYTVF